MYIFDDEYYDDDDEVCIYLMMNTAWGMVGPPSGPSGNIHPDGKQTRRPERTKLE